MCTKERTRAQHMDKSCGRKQAVDQVRLSEHIALIAFPRSVWRAEDSRRHRPERIRRPNEGLAQIRRHPLKPPTHRNSELRLVNRRRETAERQKQIARGSSSRPCARQIERLAPDAPHRPFPSASDRQATHVAQKATAGGGRPAHSGAMLRLLQTALEKASASSCPRPATSGSEQLPRATPTRQEEPSA